MSATQLSSDDRYNMQHTFNRTLAGEINLGEFLRTLMQKLDADGGVSDTDFESLLTP